MKKGLLSAALLLLPGALFAEPARVRRDEFYGDDWRRVTAINFLYGFRKAWLLQYQYEAALSHFPRGSTGLQFGAGLSATSGAELKVRYTNGTERTGDLDVTAVPLSLVLFHYKKYGFFSGKWGLGGCAYFFDGSVDMKDGWGLYEADGAGFSFVLPFEGVIAFGRGDTQLRLDLVSFIPLTRADFKSRGSQITGVAPFGGLFMGLSLARSF